MDAPLYAKSGHQGTAMALAPLAHVLYSRVMKHDPSAPNWPDRDRFILSGGHASILQYSLLFLNGYGLELDDIKAFRQWDSATPGHPEVGHTAGVEVTTGPLGQGFANAVGMAIAERELRARFGAEVMNHNTYVIAGDGCFMEGISHEAASLAGHLGLGNLICIFDDNKITIDGSTALACSDDVAARFGAYGWHVERIGEAGDDLDALEAALLRAKAVTDRPSLVILETHIGAPSPDHTDKHEAHGNPFTKDDVARTKAVMGIPDEPYWAPSDLVAAYRSAVKQAGTDARAQWQARLESSGIDRAAWDTAWGSGAGSELDALLPTFSAGDSIATRMAVQTALTAVAPALPGLIAGAADLTGNTGVKLGLGTQAAGSPSGRQVYYGIREHAMGAAMVGMALHGGTLPVGGTFFVFADYLRPSLRLAALSRAKAWFVFSHDSVGVGEDGPTHQPVEQLASIRAIPGLQVIRPADANETSAAIRAALDYDGPTAFVLSRQNLPVCTDGSAVSTGAAVVSEAEGAVITIVATGSEVHLALAAAERLQSAGLAARVVSMPSWDRFAAQPRSFRETVLPSGIPVLSVEAGSTFGWERFADACIGIDRFGASAPGGTVLDRLGINVDNVVATATALVQGA